MIGPFSVSDVAYLGVVLGFAMLSYLEKHVLKNWFDAFRRWWNKPAMAALAAHIAQSEQEHTEPVSDRGYYELQAALNLEVRQRQNDVERLEKANSEQPT